jgi:threonine dehydrogenase-like Zn-dependent dehydrogenase
MSAAAAVEAVPAGGGAIEVVGRGALADEVRRLLAARVGSSRADQRPSIVIETTGEAAQLEAALRRVDDLGTVVLAGPQPVGPLTVDLYPDLHVRGLTLVGVTPAASEGVLGR